MADDLVAVPREWLEAMEARLAQLERLAGPTDPARGGLDPLTTSHDGRTNRRGVLKHGAMLAAGTLAGAGAVSLTQAAPAGAADGDNLVLGVDNTSTQETKLTISTTDNGSGLVVTDVVTPPTADLGAALHPALLGYTSGTAWQVGVAGWSDGTANAVEAHAFDEGNGVFATSQNHYAVLGRSDGGSEGVGVAGVGEGICYGLAGSGGRSALVLTPSPYTPSPPPARTDSHVAGEIDLDHNRELWMCVADGSPGTWLRIGGPTTAGAFAVLPATVRVYDSRPGQTPTAVGPKSPLVSGVAQSVDVTANGSGVPVDATAVLVNLTVVPRSAQGFLAAYRDGIAYPGTSTLNWSTTAEPVANAAVVALAAGKISLQTNAATDVIVDVTGYWR